MRPSSRSGTGGSCGRGRRRESDGAGGRGGRTDGLEKEKGKTLPRGAARGNNVRYGAAARHNHMPIPQ